MLIKYKYLSVIKITQVGLDTHQSAAVQNLKNFNSQLLLKSAIFQSLRGQEATFITIKLQLLQMCYGDQGSYNN